MRSIWLRRFMAALAALALPAVLLRAAAPDADAPKAAASLTGQLLVASPDIGDPRFFHTVILMVRHNNEGALGIILNRFVEEKSLASLMEAIGESDSKLPGTVRIFAGGPVQTEIGFVLHTVDYHRADTIDIDGRVAMTSSPEILRDIGHNKGPKKSLVAFGYTGWSPGQLENEMNRNDWQTAPEDPGLVFDADRDKLWDIAWARRTINL